MFKLGQVTRRLQPIGTTLRLPRTTGQSIRTVVLARKLRPGVASKQKFVSSDGKTYPGDDTVLYNTKQLLGSEYTLPEPLILQTLTHKSFSHGSVPYNENLAYLGHMFLRVKAAEYAVNHAPVEDPESGVNNKNFDIAYNHAGAIVSSKVLAEFGSRYRIDQDIFYKQGFPSKTTVSSKTINAIVGAILMVHGDSKAEKFISEKLMAGPHSVLSLTRELLQNGSLHTTVNSK